MNRYRVDLHIHTVLSPCAELEMSPNAIIKRAKEEKMDVIGIADHNSTRQSEVVKQLGGEFGITVLCGAEINTKEEVHCLVFFENNEKLNEFQVYLDEHLPRVKNKPELFGDQVWVDRDNNILGVEEKLLIVALDVSMDEVAAKVNEMEGLFIPAHADKTRFSVTSQLGFLLPDIPVSGIEVSANVKMKEFELKHPWVKNYSVIGSSDAHMLNQIGSSYTSMLLEKPSFSEIKMALKGEAGRKVVGIIKNDRLSTD
ncbi:PHP domain-containing protein [Saccharicrinis sp. GN24d3]|uniref:PHP domain-containing protein n=1 Tax=Saccharicrinis sp. GN24d3 TaxID=3458416 RepID=UPI0040375577